MLLGWHLLYCIYKCDIYSQPFRHRLVLIVSQQFRIRAVKALRQHTLHSGGICGDWSREDITRATHKYNTYVHICYLLVFGTYHIHIILRCVCYVYLSECLLMTGYSFIHSFGKTSNTIPQKKKKSSSMA